MNPPAVTLDREGLSDLAAALAREWFLPTGTGGYAASTVVGANTRGQHGLLVAHVPGVGRAVMLAKLEETVVAPGGAPDDHARRDAGVPLSTNIYPGAIYPAGHANQIGFETGAGAAVFTYRASPATVRKTVFCRHGHNTVCVIYEADRPIELDVRVMLACRPAHERVRESPAIDATYGSTQGVLSLRPHHGLPILYLAHGATALDERCYWYRNVTYPVETRRGLPDREDLLSPCGLRLRIGPGQPPGLVVASTEPMDRLPDAPAWQRAEADRVARLVAAIDESEPDVARLVTAADAFLVRPSNGAVRVVAGYPWHGERARDTFIALPGLLLVTGRFDEARDILRSFATLIANGLVPNRAQDGGPTTVGGIDAPLWYIHAAGEYWRYTQDAETVREILLPACRQIVRAYLGGTEFGIKADGDGLLRGGQPGTALTWMDAVCEGQPVTPRAGKPVEVQALWYNALRTLDWLETGLNGKRLTQYAGLADIARASFISQFWNYRTSSLHDVVEAGGAAPHVRPNQVFAASLPFTMLNRQQIRGVVDALTRQLLTPAGLRTLEPADPDYVGTYAGPPVARDRACHQGTVWPWLAGPFFSAYLRAYGHNPASVAACGEMAVGLMARVTGTGCLGQLGELADGDAPHAPRGCFGQAWSVAELLRSVWEDLLDRRGRAITQPVEPPRKGRWTRRR